MLTEDLRRRMSGYRMPAEWEPHLATYLAWPHNRDTWPGRFDLIPPAFAAIIAALVRFEPVRLLVRDDDERERARAMIRERAPESAIGRVETLVIPTNDAWIRDHGPIFVNATSAADTRPVQIALDWRFNAWGEKYGPFDLDNDVPRRLAERYAFALVEPGIVLEGGSIDVNGAGTAMTTESCLLNKNRNPELTRGEIEEYLRVFLGVRNVLWLGQGIAGDDTDGHVDDLARFVGPAAVVAALEEDPADENCAPLRDNLARLRAMLDQDGRPLSVTTLPMPPALYVGGERLPASYLNFYIANGAVLMPTFGCSTDAVAAATLARLFPGREIIMIPSADLVLGLGAIHCLTQQHPKPPAR